MHKDDNTRDNDNNYDTSDNESGFIRYCLDMVGYEEYTYTYITGSINHRFEQFAGFVRGLDLCGCFGGCYDRGINENGRYRTPGDELRDIAESLIYSGSDENSENSYDFDNNENQPINDIYEVFDVKIRLSEDHFIQQVMIKYNTANKYINIPYFEPDQNPNIDNVLDKFFNVNEKNITAKNSLFCELEEYYQKSHNELNKTSDWFRSKVEWVKFSYIDHKITPCGFKRFKKFRTSLNSEISELSELSELENC